jgi:NAD(P)-dependent dehydrogenase (short-subunit alcohol dehydrogenase family)
MRSWAVELETSGVRFLSVDPGEMDTRMHRDAVPDADPAALRRPEQVARRLADLIAASESYGNGSRLVLAETGEAA